MKFVWGRRRPAEATPAPRRCGHTRVEPTTVTSDYRADDLFKKNPINSKLHGLCMDCAKPVIFAIGEVTEPSKLENWTRAMRANGYMRNELNPALWEKAL